MNRASTPRRSQRGIFSHWAFDLLLALLIVAAVLTAAQKDARNAVLDLFRSESPAAVEKLPALNPLRPLDLGRRVSLDAAREAAGFTVVVPHRKGYDKPDAVYFRKIPAGGMVSFLYGSESRVKLLITELEGEKAYEATESLAPDTATFEFAGGGDWVVGDRGPLAYRGTDGNRHVERFRLPANALLLERRHLVITIEGKLTRTEASAIAASLRPQS